MNILVELQIQARKAWDAAIDQYDVATSGKCNGFMLGLEAARSAYEGIQMDLSNELSKPSGPPWDEENEFVGSDAWDPDFMERMRHRADREGGDSDWGDGDIS
ncbi:hypothetical protein [Rhizobium anhuiense]|uniref:hypothetical protein n=1 Tax=Rhizobium anhuiense TaxID=1184720 RepID=UPI001179D3BE|nr:hypothetical protein [Rhizobium anhuiense]